MVATASPARTWLLVEQPGPWGRRLPEQSHLPRPLATRLTEIVRQVGVRLVLIRRHGRAEPRERHVFAASSGVEASWLAHASLRDIGALAELDLAPLGSGERPDFLDPDPDPLFLVCTNGRRDRCCAERGRPVARTLQRSEPERTWECSHIGGDRFAGNVVCLPHGLFFGRMGAEDAGDVAARYRRGEIDLAHFRGRSALGFVIQAAEAHLRRQHALTRVDDLRFLGRRQEDGDVVTTFEGPGGAVFEARVRIGRAESARRLTCQVAEVARPPTFDVTERGSPSGAF